MPPPSCDPEQLSETTARRVAAELERWFAGAQRDLPWRRRVRSARDRGYRALVAEAMLQQTQVARVAERFVRFLDRFPTVEALAEADEQAVLAEWQGLGYYRRARNLRAAAQIVVEKYDGAVPREVSALRSLPGVGPYTAGAIASIAFGVRTPLVDGNVQRVTARLLALDAALDSAELRDASWSLAAALVQVCETPGNLNQALMELGSTVCAPRSPACDACPVRASCRSRKLGLVDELPRPKARKTKRTIHAATVVMHRRGRVALERRPSNGLWSKMWEAPCIEAADRVDASRVRRVIEAKYGIKSDHYRDLGEFIHQTSHRTLVFTVWSAVEPRGRLLEGKWVSPSAIQGYPISNAQRRALQIGLGPLAERFLTASE